MRKKALAFFLALLMCLPSMAINVSAAGQESVTKDGAVYASVEPSLAGVKTGTKATNDLTTYQIKVGGKVVAKFFFMKSANYIELTVSDDVEFNIEWKSGNYFASCDIKGKGNYKLPRLVQENGKTKEFSNVWFSTATYMEEEPVVELTANFSDNGDCFRIDPIDRKSVV